MDIALLLLLSIAVLLYALVSNRTFGQLISAPLVFVVFGLFLGDVGIGLIELPVSSAARCFGSTVGQALCSQLEALITGL